MNSYLLHVKIVLLMLCITPVIALADTASILKQLQIDLLWYSQVLTSGVLTPEKAAEVMAGLARISAELAELSREPGIGGSSVFAPEAAQRTDIKSITVYGNPATMASTVQVVYNEEEINGVLLPVATSTLRLTTLSTSFAETDTAARTNELMLHAQRSVLPGLAVTPEQYDGLVQYSIKQYQSKEDVERVLREVGEGNFPITIGDLSVITNVTAIAGQNSFVLDVNSSENENLRISVKPYERRCGGSDGDNNCIINGRYDFLFEYTVRGVVVDKLATVNFTKSGMVNDIINEQLFLGAGALFTPAVTDTRLINEFVDFAVDSEAYYNVYQRNRFTTAEHEAAAVECLPVRVRDIISTLAEFYLGESQLSAPISQILTVRAPIVYHFDEDMPFLRCENYSDEFFPSFN